MIEHDARSVANELLQRAWDGNQQSTHLKVQKLLYYSQGWMLAMHQDFMFYQPIEAWQHGPVVRDVYFDLQRHGAGEIKHLINVSGSTFYTPTQRDLLDEVWQVYGKFTAGQLRSLTHQPGSPWQLAREYWGDSAIIPPSLMQSFFLAKLEKQHGAQDS